MNACEFPDICAEDYSTEDKHFRTQLWKLCNTNPIYTTWFWNDYNVVPCAKFWMKLTPSNSWIYNFNLRKSYLLRKINCRTSTDAHVSVSVYESEVSDIWKHQKPAHRFGAKPLEPKEPVPGYGYKLSYDKEMRKFSKDTR